MVSSLYLFVKTERRRFAYDFNLLLNTSSIHDVPMEQINKLVQKANQKRRTIFGGYTG